MAACEEFRMPASKSLSSPRLDSAVARNDASRDAGKSQCSVFSAFAAAAVVFIAAVILVSVYIGKWRRLRGEGIDENEQPFCCPREAQQTLQYVNTSLDPCDDFFEYVCSNVIKFGSWQDTSTQSELDRILLTGAMPPGVQQSPAGDFLIAYFRSCVKKMASVNDFVSDIAVTLVRMERSLLDGMDRKKAFVYAITVTSRYEILTALYVSYDDFTARLTIAYNAICTDSPFVRAIIAASVESLNIGLNVSMTIESAIQFTVTICTQIYTTNIQVTNYTAANRTNFNNDVWSIEDLELGLDSIGYSLSKVRYFTADDADRLGRMHNILSTLSNTMIEEGVVAAYFLWHSVMNIVDEFYASYDSTPQFALKSCEQSLEKVHHLSFSFKVDILTSTEKDAHARAIFAEVQDAVREECIASGIFRAEDDVKVLERFFQRLTLYTPAEVRPNRTMVPSPSRDFAENLLRGREYNFHANKNAFVRKEDVVPYMDIYFTGQSQVYLPTEVYNYIRVGTESVHLLNMAVLGRTLAEALWFMVFYGIPWTSETVTNLFRLKECYDTFFSTNYEQSSNDSITFITALGLSSVLKAFKRPGWFSVKRAWSLLRLSHAQLFYILSTYARCPKGSSPEAAYYINGPLIYVKDFAKAFSCPSDAPMAMHHQCVLASHRN